jgi:SAM-dependent methyltransferase
MWDLRRRLKNEFVVGDSIIEVGCAPGNMVLMFAKKYDLIPYGVDYTREGVFSARKNFVKSGFSSDNVFHADFFDKKFLKKHRGEFDAVCSFGFVEHFSNVDLAVKNHFSLAKKGGLVFVSVPNLCRGNRLAHKGLVLNRDIMSEEALVKAVEPYGRVEFVGYFGGVFNLGLWGDNIFFKMGMVFQKIFLETTQFVLYSLGLNFNNKFFSPGILVVVRKFG